MTTQKAVALRISELLIKNNMSQYALSVNSGLTKQAISNIINEKYTSIKLDTIIKISDAFHITFQEFFNSNVFERTKLDIN